MPSNVTDLSAFRLRKLADTPHTAGPCQCNACGHKWVGVIPCGEYIIECPECAAYTGVRASLITPPDDALHWTCACGNDRFLWLQSHHLFCDQCGAVLAPYDTD